jgi:hypothetical protein
LWSNWWNEDLAGETEVLGENLSQRHFVHHKYHMTRPGLEPGPGGKPATNRLSYGVALFLHITELYNLATIYRFKIIIIIIIIIINSALIIFFLQKTSETFSITLLQKK